MKFPEIFIAIDLETTGLNFEHDEIMEIALVRFENGKVTETLDYLIKPSNPIRPFIAKLTGIDSQALETAEDFPTLAGKIRAFIGDAPLVAHNAAFDFHFLKEAFEKIGIAFAEHPIWDSLTASRIAFQNVTNHKLSTLVETLGIKRSVAHRALPDAEACGELFNLALQKISEFSLAERKALSRVAQGTFWERIFTDANDLAVNVLDCEQDEFLYALKENVSPVPFFQKNRAERIAAYFGENGKLATIIPNFKERKDQVDFACVIERNMHKGGVSVLEAGTGVGKSIAYLIPAVCKAVSGERVVISTATKTLQEQLLNDELPKIQSLFGEALRPAVLKGRNNYICVRKFAAASQEPKNYLSDEERETFMTLIPWMAKTQTGDINENSGFNHLRNVQVWSKFVSDAAGCSGEHCPFYKSCPALLAKKKAASANLLFINHALFMADLNLDFALLPSYEHIVFDEAHRLPSVSINALGRSVKFFDLRNINKILVQQKNNAQGFLAQAENLLEEPSAFDAVREQIKETEKALHRFFLKLGKKAEKQKQEQFRFKQSIMAEFDSDPRPFTEALNTYTQAVLGVAEKLRSHFGKAEAENQNQSTRRKIAYSLAKDFENIASSLSDLKKSFEFIVQANRKNWTFYLEEPFNPHTLRLNARPLHIGKIFNEKFYPWIKSATFTSATLSVKGSLDYFLAKMGMDSNMPSHKMPFLKVYTEPLQSTSRRLLLADFISKPSAKEYQQQMENALKQILPALRENTLVLFTSLNTMLQMQKILYPIFVQMNKLLLCQNVDGSLDSLLEMFRKEHGACLLGCQTLWEGINLPGETLKNVVIPKLPFPNPADPFIAAQSEVLKEEGKNAFKELFVPEAYLGLRQGIGRLIRSETDSGSILILDSRILSEAYGKTFMRLWENKHVTVSSIDETLNQMQ